MRKTFSNDFNELHQRLKLKLRQERLAENPDNKKRSIEKKRHSLSMESRL